METRAGDPERNRSLPGVLLARAAEQPEQPWLFVQRGLDWRWDSFGAVAARVERLRAALAGGAAGPPAASGAADGAGGAAVRIGFEDDGGPDAIALDLAIQAAGACAVPLPPGPAGEARAAAPAERGCALLALFGGGDVGDDRAADAAAPAGGRPPSSAPERHRVAVLRLPREGASAAIADGAPPWADGPVLVAAGEGESRELAQAELLAEVEELAARLAPPGPPRHPRRLAALRRSGRHRDILVLPRPLADPAGRRLAAWSLAAGAALVLEPDRPGLAATAAWVRPTVFAGDPVEIAALRAEVEARRGRRRRSRGLPFRRLHTLAVLGGDPLPAADRAFWSARGTAVSVV